MMMWRVRHATRYAYERPVDLAAHMLHLRPRGLAQQRVLSHRVNWFPYEGLWRESEDHFGNTVGWLFLDSPHARFEVVSEAVVQLVPPAPLDVSQTPPWEEVVWLARSAPQAWQAAEFLLDSPMVPVLDAAREYVRHSFTPGRPVLAALLDLAVRIPRDFAYRPGATTVSTPVAQVLASRQGVCQDFAQVMISGLRGIGLPARYVSGYIQTHVPAGQLRQRGRDQSHAWVGCWLGPEIGWVDLDPTNALVVRDEHVVVAWGRDYADISPVRGVILGGGDHTLEVSVDLDPIDADETVA